MKSPSCRAVSVVIAFTLGGGAFSTSAQTPEQLLLPYQTVWKYDDSGTDLGTAWREVDFNDADWKSGPGVFLATTGSAESLHPTATQQGAQINTALNRNNSAGTAQVRTYYFRKWFNVEPPPPGTALMLWSSNLVDDGAVFCLNGQEARRVHMPPGTILHGTFASSPGVEVSRTGNPDTPNDGGYYELTLASSNLVAGENLLAVEVHDLNATSAEVVFGLSLAAKFPELPAIMVQPTNQTLLINGALALAVSASGEPPFAYQWQKDNGVGTFTNIPNATNPLYSVAKAQLDHSGQYRAVVSNLFGAATSHVAQVQVVPDETGPALVAAVAEPTPPYYIIVTFSEPVEINSALRVTNYGIIEPGTGQVLPISATAWSPWTSNQVRLTVSPWNSAADYVLTVNHVEDMSANRNVIAPNSQVGISFTTRVPILATDHLWRWNEEGLDLGEAWWTQRLDGTLYGEGAGVFFNETDPVRLCSGALTTPISLGPVTHYFVTEFLLPDGGPWAAVEVHSLVDDGLILYLNGQEALRHNLPPAPTVIRYDTRASSRIDDADCLTNYISTSLLQPGTNRLAAEVHQSSNNFEPDVTFGLAMVGRVIRESALPAPPVPRLHLERQDTQLTLSWAGGGYALESAAQFNGPWREVQPGMANPYRTSTTHSIEQFWRLKNKQSPNP